MQWDANLTEENEIKELHNFSSSTDFVALQQTLKTICLKKIKKQTFPIDFLVSCNLKILNLECDQVTLMITKNQW